MNHLNLFRSYSREDRGYQLENDLTRAFALCLQEDALLLHEVLKFIFKKKTSTYKQLFSQSSEKANIQIEIQKRIADLEEFTHLFAVSLSEFPLNESAFFEGKNEYHGEPITDLMIAVNDMVIIVEVKPNYTDCAAQLYHQAKIACENHIDKSKVTPVDMNWKNLMEIVMLVANFNQMVGKPSRFVNDFITLIRNHNAAWLPQLPFSQQPNTKFSFKSYERLDAGVAQAKTEPVGYNDRHGFSVDFGWASEILFDFICEDGNPVLRTYIWPGNTKGQGWHLFGGGSEPEFKDFITIRSKTYGVHKAFHLKFTHFQKFISALDGTDEVVLKKIVNAENFREVSGRQKRDSGHWEQLASFFDAHFKPNFDWRTKCGWNENFINSGRSYFDISFGYCLTVDVPFGLLQEIDTDRNNLEPLAKLLDEIVDEFRNILIS